MKKLNNISESPALGCQVGHAYQILLSQLAQALKAVGLDITTGEYLVLRAVFSRPGLQQCDIAEMVGKDKAAVCRCVAALEKKGLLTTDAVSFKCLKVYPSRQALDLRPRIMEVAAQRHQALMDLAGHDDLEVFSSVLNKIINSK